MYHQGVIYSSIQTLLLRIWREVRGQWIPHITPYDAVVWQVRAGRGERGIELLSCVRRLGGKT